MKTNSQTVVDFDGDYTKQLMIYRVATSGLHYRQHVLVVTTPLIIRISHDVRVGFTTESKLAVI